MIHALPFFVSLKDIYKLIHIVMNLASTVTNRNSSMIRGFVSLFLGLILIIWPDAVSRSIVYVIGGALLVAGIVSFAISMKRQKDGRYNTFVSVNGAVDLVFGLLLVLFPDFFLGILMYLFAAVIIVLGAGQIMNLRYTSKIAKVPFWMYILPVLVLIAGVVIIFNPFGVLSSIFVFSGVVLAVYALAEIFDAWKFRNDVFVDDYGRRHSIEDVDYKEE